MNKITRKEDYYINQIVNYYLNNQDTTALRLTSLYLESGYIKNTDKLERKIKEGIQQLIKLERNYQEGLKYHG